VDGLFSWLDTELSRTCLAPDSRDGDDRFLVVALGLRYGILDMILVVEERLILSWSLEEQGFENDLGGVMKRLVYLSLQE
jgi:hypothetical protein